jgi:hypothetical protein
MMGAMNGAGTQITLRTKLARVARRLAVPLCLVIVAACETAPLPPPIPQLTYSHLAPIEIAAARIEIVEDYKPPLRTPNVEHRFPTPPAQAVRQWVKDRLRAVGDEGVLRVVIRDASVIETELEKTGGVRGAFTNDQSERYDARLEVVVEVRSVRGFQDAFASAIATRSRTVAEDISLYDRELVFFDMTKALMEDLNAELEKNIEQFLARFIR